MLLVYGLVHRVGQNAGFGEEPQGGLCRLARTDDVVDDDDVAPQDGGAFEFFPGDGQAEPQFVALEQAARLLRLVLGLAGGTREGRPYGGSADAAYLERQQEAVVAFPVVRRHRYDEGFGGDLCGHRFGHLPDGSGFAGLYPVDEASGLVIVGSDERDIHEKKCLCRFLVKGFLTGVVGSVGFVRI